MRLRMLISVVLLMGLAGCGTFPGKAKIETVDRPDQVLDFHTLYSANCAACHGRDGQNGPSMDLANPEFEALVDDDTVRRIVTSGMPGTEMPAWAQSAGGMLTAQQVQAIVGGMRQAWAKPNAFDGATPPPVGQPQGGDVQRGQQAYQARCAACHQGPKRQQVTSPVYLSLISDEALRIIIIAGRPDIGQPDWRHDTPNGAEGQPLSAQDVTDIVTYLASLRNPAAVSAAPLPIPPRR